MTDPSKSWCEPKFLCYLFPFVLLIVAWLVYGNTLHRQFMIDDHVIYTEAELGNQDMARYFIPDAAPAVGHKTVPTYRPLTKMIWTLTYRWFGSDPVGYHVFNIFVFWLTCCALFFFILSYTRWAFVAVAATLLFCVHPFQGLMLNNLPTILNSVEMMFMLLAMIFFKCGLERPAEKAGWTAFSFSCTVLALLIHEAAAAFPLYLLCALVYGLGFRWKDAFKAASPYLILSAAYFILRLKFASIKSGLWDQAQFFGLSFVAYLASFAKLIGWYLAQLISPSRVVLIWTTPVVEHHAWIYIAALAVFLCLCTLFFRLTKQPILRWGMAWLAIGFAPVSLACLFRLSEGLCLESLWLTFASIGYFLMLGYLLDWLWGYRRPLGVAALAVLLVCLSSVSRIYNRIWSDERRYCLYALSTAPSYVSGYFWLGTAFMRDHEYDLARHFLPLGLPSKVYNRQIYNNLGIMDFEEGKWDSAEKNFLSAIEENPQHDLAYNYLGNIYLQRNEIDRAKKILRQALEIDPKDTEARLGLALIEEKGGHWKEALDYYQQNLKEVPHDGDTLFSLLRLFVQHQDPKRVLDIHAEILRYNRDSVLLTAAGEFLAQAGYPSLALQTLERALMVNPRDKEVYLVVGKVFGNLNRFDDAIGAWKEGSALDRQDPRFSELIAQARALARQQKQSQLIR
jgi:tetratricopeptide (TPR) repeat protein